MILHTESFVISVKKVFYAFSKPELHAKYQGSMLCDFRKEDFV